MIPTAVMAIRTLTTRNKIVLSWKMPSTAPNRDSTLTTMAVIRAQPAPLGMKIAQVARRPPKSRLISAIGTYCGAALSRYSRPRASPLAPHRRHSPESSVRRRIS